MYIRDNVINLCELKRTRQQAKDDELERLRFEHEQRCNALFISQHSDDDTCTNEDEFTFTDSNHDTEND